MPAQPVKPVLCSWGSGGSGGLLHEDCEDRSLLPTSLSSDDADASSAADDTDDTNNAAAADAAALQAAEVEALSRLGRRTILFTATGAVLVCVTSRRVALPAAITALTQVNDKDGGGVVPLL